MKIVVALGGNAIIRAGEKGEYQQQITNIRETAKALVGLIEDGHQLIVTHGNGPQVGNLLIQHAAAVDTVPALPMDVCGAQSQGQIGYLLQQQLGNFLRRKKLPISVATVITQVEVSSKDPAFENPSKPVGPFYDKAWAKNAQKQGLQVIEDSGRGWRRVVPSPLPKKIIEEPIIKALIDSHHLVISSGGGGVPVIKEKHQYHGIEAVIDKDRVGSLMAQKLGADLFVILTDVAQVAINFNSPDQENLSEISVLSAQKYAQQGHFGKGSMGPKVEAVIDFVKKTGNSGLITSASHLSKALKKKSGTWIFQ